MRDIAVFVGLRIAWVLAKWWLDKKNREAHARELVELFKKVQADGVILANQLGKEMSKQSNTTWEDIPIRGIDESSEDGGAADAGSSGDDGGIEEGEQGDNRVVEEADVRAPESETPDSDEGANE